MRETSESQTRDLFKGFVALVDFIRKGNSAERGERNRDGHEAKVAENRTQTLENRIEV